MSARRNCNFIVTSVLYHSTGHFARLGLKIKDMQTTAGERPESESEPEGRDEMASHRLALQLQLSIITNSNEIVLLLYLLFILSSCTSGTERRFS